MVGRDDEFNIDTMMWDALPAEPLAEKSNSHVDIHSEIAGAWMAKERHDRLNAFRCPDQLEVPEHEHGISDDPRRGVVEDCIATLRDAVEIATREGLGDQRHDPRSLSSGEQQGEGEPVG